MEIKNFIVNNLDLTTDLIVKGLCVNNIDYVLIKEKEYQEIHYLDKIYRFFDIKNKYIISQLLESKEMEVKLDNMRAYNMRLYINSLSEPDYMKVGSENKPQKMKKHGYKVLRKNDYKRKQSIKNISPKNRNR